jgi:hypothetical protein
VSGVPVVNPLRGFTSGVLPEAKLHTGYKPWTQAWSLRFAQTPEAKLQSSFATVPLQSLVRIPAPQGMDIIPMIDNLATNFELMSFGLKYYISQ